MSICCKDVVELSNQKLLVSTIIEVVCDCWKYETITSESGLHSCGATKVHCSCTERQKHSEASTHDLHDIGAVL